MISLHEGPHSYLEGSLQKEKLSLCYEKEFYYFKSNFQGGRQSICIYGEIGKA